MLKNAARALYARSRISKDILLYYNAIVQILSRDKIFLNYAFRQDREFVLSYPHVNDCKSKKNCRIKKIGVKIFYSNFFHIENIFLEIPCKTSVSRFQGKFLDYKIGCRKQNFLPAKAKNTFCFMRGSARAVRRRNGVFPDRPRFPRGPR